MSVKFTSEDLIDHDAVAAVIRDGDARVLVCQHLKWGFWSVPIGKAHPGQTPEDGLCEEMREELGIAVTGTRKSVSALVRYTDNRDVTLRFHVFEIGSYEGRIQNREPEKHSDWTYLSLEELARKDALSDATLLMLQAENVTPDAPWSGELIGEPIFVR